MTCLDTTRNGCPIIGDSEVISNARDIALKAAKTPFSVLILGERGTGKELFARFIHENSSRASKPFIAVNCAALPESIMDSELLGIEDKTATGVKAKPGLFEAADEGTIFLDEIGDMPIAAQAKILRALQEKEITRVGGRKSIPVDIRIIAATNKVEEIYDEGVFRADLLDRLNDLPLELPPIRERNGDIVTLIKYFLEKYGSAIRITGAARNLLESYTWPGNVRELESMAKKIVTFAREKPRLTFKDLLSIYPRLNGEGIGVIDDKKSSAASQKRDLRQEILDYLSQNGAAGRICICKELNIPPATFTRYVGELCADKKVVPIGNGRATKYRPAKPEDLIRGSSKMHDPGDFESRREALVEYLKSNGRISRPEYEKLTGVSRATASRDLEAMIKSGLILKRGSARATEYLLKDGGSDNSEAAVRSRK